MRDRFSHTTILVAWLVVTYLCAPAPAQDFQSNHQIRRLVDAVEQQNTRIAQLERERYEQQTPTYLSARYRYQEEGENGSDLDIAQRFDKLEEQFGDLSETVDGITSDKTYVRSGSSASTLKVSGRVHLDAWGFSNTSGAIDQFEGSPADPADPQDRIGFRRIRFGVAGTVKENMLYKIEMEFASPENLAYKDVYLGWTDLAILRTVLMGVQKRPYGLDHLNSSRYNVFMERPFVVEGFNQDTRRIGLCSYGVSENLSYNWRYGVFQMADTQNTGNFIDDALQLEFAGRFANTVWYDEVSDGRGYAHWAVSGTFADPSGFGDENQARFRTRPEARSTNRWLNTDRIEGAETYGLLGLEGVVNVGPLQVVGEYQNVWMSREPGFGDDLFFNGGYFYVSYFLTGEHIPWERDSGTLGRVKPFQNFWCVRRCDDGIEKGWGAWQIAARYSRGDFTDDNVFGGVGDSFTFGLNWHWNANARMQFNYLRGRIEDRFATLESGDYSIFGTRFMIDF